MLKLEDSSEIIKKIVNMKEEFIVSKKTKNKQDRKNNINILYLNKYDIIFKISSKREIHLLPSENKFLLIDSGVIIDILKINIFDIKDVKIEIDIEYYSFTNLIPLISFIQKYHKYIKIHKLSSRVVDFDLEERWMNLSNEIKDYLMDDIKIFTNKKINKTFLELFFYFNFVSEDISKHFVISYLKSGIKLKYTFMHIYNKLGMFEKIQKIFNEKSKRECLLIIDYLLFDLYRQGYRTIDLALYLQYFNIANYYGLDKFPCNFEELCQIYQFRYSHDLSEYKIFENEKVNIYKININEFISEVLKNNIEPSLYLPYNRYYKIIKKINNEKIFFTSDINDKYLSNNEDFKIFSKENNITLKDFDF